MKPLDFSCILKLSKSQLTETGFKDATVEAVYGGLLTYLADNSNKVGQQKWDTAEVGGGGLKEEQ